MNDYPKIALRGLDGIIFVTQNEIIYALADGNYTHVYLTNNRCVKILRKLKQVNELLSNDNFTRIHRSHLINLKHIVKFDDNDLVEMSDGNALTVSRACKGSFIQKFIRL